MRVPRRRHCAPRRLLLPLSEYLADRLIHCNLILAMREIEWVSADGIGYGNSLVRLRYHAILTTHHAHRAGRLCKPSTDILLYDDQ